VIKEQLLPCKALFDPEIFTIISMKPVLEWEKSEISEKGLLVIDNFTPVAKGFLSV